MKRFLTLSMVLVLLLTACDSASPSANPPTTTVTSSATTAVVTDSTQTELLLDGIPLDGVFGWFAEVCLDAEFSDGDDSVLVQKWMTPIRYMLCGTPTAEDIQTVADVVAQLNGIDGFPGMTQTDDAQQCNVRLYFCSSEELVQHLGDPFTADHYGGTRFWYNDRSEIDGGIVCYRNDIDQQERCAVIIEEIYNLLGPVQDTETRKDSVIYQYSNKNTVMSAVDYLILQLLYHPAITCGMDSTACERVITQLLEEQAA